MYIETRFEITGVPVDSRESVTYFENDRWMVLIRIFAANLSSFNVKVTRFVFGEPLADDGTSAEVCVGPGYGAYLVKLRAGGEETEKEFESFMTALRVADGWCRCE